MWSSGEFSPAGRLPMTWPVFEGQLPLVYNHKPTASKYLAGLLDEKGIELVTEFNTGEVDGNGDRLIGYDGRELAFDLRAILGREFYARESHRA